MVLTEEAEQSENRINLEDKDTITAFLRSKVNSSSSLEEADRKLQVEELIGKAKLNWQERHGGDGEEMMLPLIRLKVWLFSVAFMCHVFILQPGRDFRGEGDDQSGQIWTRFHRSGS